MTSRLGTGKLLTFFYSVMPIPTKNFHRTNESGGYSAVYCTYSQNKENFYVTRSALDPLQTDEQYTILKTFLNKM